MKVSQKELIPIENTAEKKRQSMLQAKPSIENNESPSKEKYNKMYRIQMMQNNK